MAGFLSFKNLPAAADVAESCRSIPGVMLFLLSFQTNVKEFAKVADLAQIQLVKKFEKKI